MRPEWSRRSFEDLVTDPAVPRDELLAEYLPTLEESVIWGAVMEQRFRANAGSGETFVEWLRLLRSEHLGDMPPAYLRALALWFRQRAGMGGDVATVTAFLLAGEVVDSTLADRMQEWRR